MTRVPGGIEYNHAIGPDKIDAETSSSGGHQEQFDFGIGIKVVYEFFPLERSCAAVKPVVVDASDPRVLGLGQLLALEEIFNKVQSEE